MALTAAEVAEIMAMATATIPASIFVTVNRHRYEVTGSMVLKIRAERERAGSFRRSGRAPRASMILDDLHEWLTGQLGTDGTTAHQILKRIDADTLYR